MGKRALGKLRSFLFVAGLLAVTMGFSVFQQTGSGMIGWWRFEESAGPTSADSSVPPLPGPNPGTWTGGVSALAGPANTPPLLGTNSTQCLSFNGTDGYVSVPDAPGLAISGDFTAALWVYKQADHPSDWVRLMGKGDSNVRTFGVWEYPGAAGEILFQQYNGSGGAVLSYPSTGTIPVQQWTHVAVRMMVNAARIYINGLPSGDGTRSGPPGIDTNPLTIGAGVLPGLHSYWNGRIDDVRLYDRALGDAEILSLAQGNYGPPAPANLTATPGNNSVALAWNASGATVFNIKRATVSGGPYTTLASNIAINNYADNTAVNGTNYYYVVSGVSFGEGANSNEASAMPNPVTALPNTGLQTSELGASAVFNLRLTTALTAGDSISFTVQSLDASEGGVSGSGQPFATTINFTVNGPQAVGFQIPITVTGVDDLLVDPATLYQVSVSMTSTQATFTGITIPNIQLTNNDNDVAGITLSRTSGLVTTENLGTDTFSVSLNTQPSAPVTMTLTSTNPQEGTVSTGMVTFNTSSGAPDGWNFAQVITLTGVDDTALDFTVPYTIITGDLSSTDGNYNTMPVPDVSAINMDNEPIPTLPPVWDGGSGGGCGLLGLELALPFLLLGLWRRRRTAEGGSGGQRTRVEA